MGGDSTETPEPAEGSGGPEDGRYARQELISWWEQERLMRSRVLVVGAGALGNEIVKNLALVGVGSVAVIDLDTVENSNLARCVMFRDGDDGAAKAPLLAERAKEMNPTIETWGFEGDVRHDVGLGTFMDADVVIGGLDNQEARLAVDERCWKTTTPWVDGAIEGLMGVMRVFVPPDSACFESTMSREDHVAMAQRRACTLLTRDELQGGRVPTTATSASIIAGMQVQEAIKLIHAGEPGVEQFGGCGVFYNGMTHDTYTVHYTVRGDELTRDSYELEGVRNVAADATFAEMLDGADDSSEHHLVLEHEVVRAFSCAKCDERAEVMRPITALTAGAALCESCGTERALELFHNIEASDTELLGLTMADVGLPEGDLVTIATPSERTHLLVGEGGSLFRG